MLGLLQKLLNISLKGSLKKILIGAGVGLASSAIMLTVLNYYVAKLVNHLFGQFGEFSRGVIALFGIAGVDTALSIIVGAYIIKFSIKATQVFLSKK